MILVILKNILIFFIGSNSGGEIKVDNSNGQTKTNNNLITKINLEPTETIPSLNLYQPVKTRAAPITTKQETVKQEAINQDNNSLSGFHNK